MLTPWAGCSALARHDFSEGGAAFTACSCVANRTDLSPAAVYQATTLTEETWPRGMAKMKPSLWFDTSMLALVLICAIAGTLAEAGVRHHGVADSAQPVSSQPQRLASGL